MPWTTLVADTPITSSWANANVRDQTMAIFANAAARAAAIPSPSAGQLSYLQDTRRIEQYTTATTGWQLPWSLAWGNLFSSNNAGVGAIGLGSTAELVCLTTSVLTVPANRKLRISGHVTLSYNVPFYAEVRIRRGTTTGGVEVARARLGVPDPGFGSRATVVIPPIVDIGYTPGSAVQYVITAEGAEKYHPSSLTVADDGPNGAPA